MIEREIFTDRKGNKYVLPTREERIQDYKAAGMMLLGGMIGTFTGLGVLAAFFGIHADANGWAEPIILIVCGYGGAVVATSIMMRLRDGHWPR